MEEDKIKAMKIVEFIKKNKILIIIVSSIVILLSILLYLFYPKITLIGKAQEEIILNKEYKEKGSYYNYLFNKKNKNILINGQVDYNRPGKYVITYQVNKGPFKSIKKRTVIVKDKDKPKITLKGKTEVNVCPNKTYVEEGFDAIDNYDLDITSKVLRQEEKDIIYYSVKDSSSNEDKQQRKIFYQDKDAPLITLKGVTEETIILGNKYQEEGFNAFDNCEGDITSKVEVSGNVNEAVLGDYIITYTVKDNANNETKVERTIHVQKEKSCTKASYGGKPGVIYLTFDDGPSTITTGTILDILKSENVKATFFVINHGGTDDLLRRIVNEGHTIGLHSASHNFRNIYQSENAFFNDLFIIKKKVKDVTGVDSYLLRFPGGSSNTVSNFNRGIMCSLSKEVINKGYHYFDWNVTGSDAGGTTIASGVYNSVITNLSKTSSNVVLLHDIKPWTRDALKDIIHYGKNNGYTFDKITMDTTMIRHKVAN